MERKKFCIIRDLKKKVLSFSYWKSVKKFDFPEEAVTTGSKVIRVLKAAMMTTVEGGEGSRIVTTCVIS